MPVVAMLQLQLRCTAGNRSDPVSINTESFSMLTASSKQNRAASVPYNRHQALHTALGNLTLLVGILCLHIGTLAIILVPKQGNKGILQLGMQHNHRSHSTHRDHLGYHVWHAATIDKGPCSVCNPLDTVLVRSRAHVVAGSEYDRCLPMLQ